jgi:hypothetical protein
MTSRGRLFDLGLAVLVAVQLSASAWLVPAGDAVAVPGGEGIRGLCWFRAVFHIDCPFCGLTRSFVALAHGDVVAALRWHPAGPLLFTAMVVALVAIALASLARGRPMAERRGFQLAFEAVIAVSLTVGVFKMMRS